MIDQKEIEIKTDEDLVKLSLQNPNYFTFIISRYREKILRYIFRISNFSEDDAEDIVQDVFIKVYQYLNSFDDSLKFSSWIYRIAHNLIIDKFRKNSKLLNINSEDKAKILENIKSEINIEKDTNLKILNENILNILNNIDVKYREVLILKFLEEKDYNEISDILKKPIGTVGTLINRAKVKFKESSKKYNLDI